MPETLQHSMLIEPPQDTPGEPPEAAPEQPGDLVATAEYHSRVRTSGPAGLSAEEAAGRQDVILDREAGYWRELRPGELVSADTPLAWRLDGGAVIDLTPRQAFEYGVVSEWNPEWGPEPVDPNALPEGAEEGLREMASQAVSGDDVREGFSEDTPVEAATVMLHAELQGASAEDAAEFLETGEVRFGSDGSVTLSDDARDYFANTLGMGEDAEKGLRQAFQAWRKVAEATVGPQALTAISQAARFNPDAAEDVRRVYRLGATGKLTRADLIRLAERWAS